MATSYVYIKSADYINGLNFEYLETYTLQPEPRDYLINMNGKFHNTSRLTNSFTKEDAFTKTLQDIFLTESSELAYSACAPIFRDGIVFYNGKAKIVSCLNICFECEYMQLDHLTYVNGDIATYAKLRDLFAGIGHKTDGGVMRRQYQN